MVNCSWNETLQDTKKKDSMFEGVNVQVQTFLMQVGLKGEIRNFENRQIKGFDRFGKIQYNTISIFQMS